ncbi:MAG: hypothetical protein JWQ41_2180, partial [Variovorax sp.]|nr:hypothetical protein [Variovorax sp.]
MTQDNRPEILVVAALMPWLMERLH